MSFKFQNSTTEDEKTVETSPLIFGKTGTTVMTNNPIDNRLNSIVQELIDSGIEIKPTKKRWLILFIYIIAAITNSMIWITFSPISVMAVDYYQLSGPFWINCLFLFISFISFLLFYFRWELKLLFITINFCVYFNYNSNRFNDFYFIYQVIKINK